jgi:pimeloyl-ACP methyl ester carboxylesterase
MATFVLVHGAWHGGWCWARVAEILRGRSHRVTTPTQTGLGERRHLMSRGITLDTFGADIVNHLIYEDIAGAVLVGHSFAGSAISLAAERARDRVARLIYLDAVVIEGGERAFDGFGPEMEANRTARAEAHDGGLSLPPPPAASFGIEDPEQAAWLEARMTPHPFSTYVTPIGLSAPPGARLPATYVRCTDPPYTALDWAEARARALGWPVETIATGHDCMVSAPQETADLLERLAG